MPEPTYADMTSICPHGIYPVTVCPTCRPPEAAPGASQADLAAAHARGFAEGKAEGDRLAAKANDRAEYNRDMASHFAALYRKSQETSSKRQAVIDAFKRMQITGGGRGHHS